MLGVQPGQFCMRMKWCTPLDASVVLELGTEQRVGQAGEVVVVDAGVDERRRQSQLPNVVLDGELGSP